MDEIVTDSNKPRRYIVGSDGWDNPTGVLIEKDPIEKHPNGSHSSLAVRHKVRNARGGNLIINDDDELVHIEGSRTIDSSDQQVLNSAKSRRVLFVK